MIFVISSYSAASLQIGPLAPKGFWENGSSRRPLPKRACDCKKTIEVPKSVSAGRWEIELAEGSGNGF